MYPMILGVADAAIWDVLLGQFSRLAEHFEQHLFRQLARGSILLAGVVTCQQHWLTRRDLVFAIVPEDERGAAGDDAARFHDSQVSIEGDLTQGDDHLDVAQRVQFALQERPAVAEFFRQWLIAGRRAAGRGGDVKRIEL